MTEGNPTALAVGQNSAPFYLQLYHNSNLSQQLFSKNIIIFDVLKKSMSSIDYTISIGSTISFSWHDLQIWIGLQLYGKPLPYPSI